MDRQPQLIELTEKRFKRVFLVGIVIALLGMVTAMSGLLEQGSLWWGGFAVMVTGFAIAISAQVRAWWHTG